MGYTHYWYTRKDADPELLAEAGRQMAKVVEMEAVRLEVAELDFATGAVLFNGRGEEAHEAFCWPPDLARRHAWMAHAQDEVFDFCKTARKPYDEAVTACLLVAKMVMGEAIALNTDGDDEDWQDGMRLFREAIGLEPPAPLFRHEEEAR